MLTYRNLEPFQTIQTSVNKKQQTLCRIEQAPKIK